MSTDWDLRISAFWSSADDADPNQLLQPMRVLVDERPPGDARALYEWASVHDFLGLEVDAIPGYRAALAAGLDDEHEPQAIVQLASSLRNIGQPHAAIDLLQSAADSPVTGAAAQAFLALALHDAGRPGEALRVALLALAPTLPMYSAVITGYTDALDDHADGLHPREPGTSQ